MRKIGLFCLALVMVLGSLGVAYAAWIDTVIMSGTVETGSLDLTVFRTDGDDVYKDLDTGALVYCHWIQDVGGVKQYWTLPPDNGLLVAWTTSELTDDDVVTVSYNNLFPFDGGSWGGFVTSERLVANGTVPMHLRVTPEIVGIPEAWVSYIWFVYTYENGPLVDSGTSLVDLDGIQLHEGYIVSFAIVVTVPQEDGAMNQSGTVSVTIDGIQWNEYP